MPFFLKKHHHHHHHHQQQQQTNKKIKQKNMTFNKPTHWTYVLRFAQSATAFICFHIFNLRLNVDKDDSSL